MIRRLLVWLRSFVFAVFFFSIVISICIWFLGPLLALGEWRPFDGFWKRIIWIGVVWFIAFFALGLRFWLRRRRDRKMADDIVDAADDPAAAADAAVQAELGDLRDKLKTAMTALRKTKGGKRHLYELPWYVIIGPPGAGKTTAIVNSGLNFPLAAEMGKTSVGGVGGTRNCDWWFTENAVLIDTAGRYTTQESDAQADNAAWQGFLSLLKKHRPRQPVNGAIIAISLSDLSMQDEVTQAGHARAVRRRLHELREKLGVRFPVYVLFTKADLIAGFQEFFEHLGKEDRGQVWGFTFKLDRSKGEVSPVANFDEEFAALLGRLNSQSLERLQSESDHARRSLIAGFPGQLASVRQVARDFLAEVFQDNRYEHRHILRGVYFTSGTQEGTPIDRLMMNMARTFGIGRQAIGTGRGTGRSYFLTRLFEAVIFPEAGLVSADDKAERRYRWTKRIAIAASVLVFIGVAGLWTRSFLGNRELLAQANESIALYQTAAAAIPGNPISDTDLPAIVPALNTLRDMPGNPAIGDPDVPGELTWGLYQGKVVGTQAAQTYRAALNQHLLPRLLLRLEEQMQANINNPDFLYEALKIYLMLGLQGPLNENLVAEWMKIDWSLSYPGDSRAQLREDMEIHLRALLDQPMDQIALNGPLVEQIQGLLLAMPMAQRVYNGIIYSAAAKALPEWRISGVGGIGGPNVDRALVRSSGKPMTEGIEGIYTNEGFRTVFVREVGNVSQRLQNESWVLGPRAETEQTEAALNAIRRDVLAIYYNDFISRYDTLLGDIDIIPMQSESHAVEVINVLSGSTSPIVNILTEVAKETMLTKDPTPIANEEVQAGIDRIAQNELASVLQGDIASALGVLQNSLSAAGAQGSQAEPGAFVEERFAWLHQLVAKEEGQRSQLDELMGLLTEVYTDLNKRIINPNAALTGSEALALFQQAAGRVPGPLQRWSTQISTGSAGIAAGGTRAQIDARWQSAVLPFCTQALTDRYPFSRRSQADVGIQDFAKLFAPGGLIDSFFNENLAQHVDTRTKPWTWKTLNNADLGISPAVLEQMQYAAEIRDAFFSGGPQAAVSFQITPEALDPKAQALLLDIDGQQIAFQHRDGAPKPTAITWPGSVGVARLALAPPAADSESQISRDGPWAWFRLLDAAEVRRTNVSDRSRVIFNVGGRIVIFQLQSGSVLNPFQLPALSKFSCPKSF